MPLLNQAPISVLLGLLFIYQRCWEKDGRSASPDRRNRLSFAPALLLYTVEFPFTGTLRTKILFRFIPRDSAGIAFLLK